jgi:DNA-binding NtrC family response regulator
MQKKLMRAIEDSTITRVGGVTPIHVDIRIIAASNRNLEQMVEQGELRHDFYHRLNVVNVHVPSLSERREDIPALIDAMVEEFSEKYNRRIQGFDNGSLQRLCDYSWQGNIRELRNTIERSVILSDGPVLHWDSLGKETEVLDDLPVSFSSDDFVSLEALEQEYISHVLKCFNGKKTKAAQILGIDKTTLWRKLRRYEEQEEMV